MRIFHTVMLLTLCLALSGSVLASQDTQTPQANAKPLTNADIIDMLGAGLSQEIVIAKIGSSKCDFDTSPATLKELKIANVPDAVILAMVKAPTNMPRADSVVSDQNPLVAEKPSDETKQETIQKAMIFITNSQSWSAVGVANAANGVGFGASVAGSSPQTVEVIHDFAKQCPDVTVTNDREKAAYIVLFDRDANAAVRNKIAVFKKNGELVFSGKTHTVANAVKDACAALKKK